MQVLAKHLTTPLRLPRLRRAAGPVSFPVGGASIGLVAFLFVGLLPALLLGGSASAHLVLAMGAEGTSGYGLNAVLVLGVVAATTVGALFFAAVGAAGGAALGALTWDRPPGEVTA